MLEDADLLFKIIDKLNFTAYQDGDWKNYIWILRGNQIHKVWKKYAL